MPVITISRELGSRGDDVALAVAERLQLQVVGRELINRAARAAGAPEMALAEIDELGLLGVRPRGAVLAQYRAAVAAVMRERAAAGNVLLVGRGAQIVLADWPGALHVRIVAPASQRLRVIQERCGISPEAAEARMQASDRARAGFHRQTHHVKWEDPLLYDLVLNMERLTVAEAVATICAAAGSRGQGSETA